MTDINSKLDLGNESKIFMSVTGSPLVYTPNWGSNPSRTLSLGRDINRKVVSIPMVRYLTEDTAFSASYQFTNLSKSEEYCLLNFFWLTKGRCKRFWLPVLFQDLELTQNITAGAYTVKIRDTGFTESLQGYERLFFTLKDTKALYTRQILSAPDSTTLTLKSAINMNIAITNISHFGRLILCRFDMDELEVSHLNYELSEVALSFKELTKEYHLLEEGAES